MDTLMVVLTSFSLGAIIFVLIFNRAEILKALSLLMGLWLATFLYCLILYMNKATSLLPLSPQLIQLGGITLGISLVAGILLIKERRAAKKMMATPKKNKINF
mgnify:CR=1 FL=1